MIDILNKINELENLKNEIQDLWEGFLKNKNYSLEERWNLFVKHGQIFGRRDRWAVSLDIEQKLPGKEICWYDDFGIERHQTVQMKRIVERIEEDYLDEDEGWTPELIQEFKEEILHKNLWSFENDW